MALDQLATVRQTIPRLGRLLTRLRPTFQLNSVSNIDADFLTTHGFEAVLWDIDGTIMAYHADDIDPAFHHLRDMFRNGPGRHGVLSNCDEERFVFLGEVFQEIPVFRGYHTDAGSVFRHRVGGTDTHTDSEIAALLSEGGRQIRKPSGELIEYAMSVFQVVDPSTVLMVGDQYLTDVASANLAGARSAKVRTFRKDTFPWLIRFSQVVEGLVYRAFRPVQARS